MTKNRAKWACEHGQITKIWLSDRYGGKKFQWWWDMGKVGVDLKVIWEISV